MIRFRAAPGRLPFEGEDWYEIARQHVEEPAPSPRSIVPTLSEAFERVILRLLAKDPNDRPATGEQLGEELPAVLAQRDGTAGARTISVPAMPAAPSPAPGARAPGSPRRSRGGAPAAAPRRTRRFLPSAIASLVLVVAIAAALWPRISQRIGFGAPVDSLGLVDTGGASRDSTLVSGEDSLAGPVTPPGS